MARETALPATGRGSRRAARTRRAVAVGTAGVAGATAVAALAACDAAGGPPASGGADASGELTWLIADYGGTDGQTWFEQTLVPAFRQSRPKVQVTLLPVTWGDHGQKRDTLFAAGQGPDLLQSGAGQAHAWRKLVLPLEDRLRRWKEWGDYYPPTLATSTWQGKPFGVPARIDARAMVYRQDLFQREGIPLPTTWDAFRDAALRLSKRQGNEVIQVGYDPVDWDGGFGSQRFIPKLWQAGAEVVSQDGRKVLFNSPEGVEALRWWTDLLNTIAPPGATLPTAPANASRVAGGGAAAILAGQWIQTGAITAVPEAVPHIVVRPPLQQRRAQVNVFANWFGVGAQTKLPDSAWDLLQSLNRADNLLEYCRLTGSTLPRKGLPDSAYTSDSRYQIKAWGEVLEKYSRPQPLIVTQTGSNTNAAMTDAMKATREGRQSPKQALDEAARQWQEAIDGGHRELGL